jgi:hypothetical protein
MWRQSEPTALARFAAMICDATIGSACVEREHARSKAILTKQRNQLSLVRSNASQYLHQHFNSASTKPDADFGACLDLIRDANKLSDEDEAFLESMENRHKELEALKRELEETKIVVEEELVEAEILSNVQQEEVPVGRPRRRATSRFATILAAEVANEALSSSSTRRVVESDSSSNDGN